MWQRHQPDNLFNLGTRAKLDTKRSEIFRTFVAKGLFCCKRAKAQHSASDLGAVHKSQGSESGGLGKADESNEIFEQHQEGKLNPERDELRVVKWYVDASFAVHLDFKSHTGAVMMLEKGEMQSIARNQKMNVWSSTEGELVTVDNTAPMILWMKLFLEAQEYNVEKNIVYQDNKSAILLETNAH
jgi:hypothetical protein